MGHSRKTENLVGINRCLHQSIIEDISSDKSLIITKLLNDYRELEKNSIITDSTIKEILPFMNVHRHLIDCTNPEKTFRTIIKNKLSNLRLTNNDTHRTCFSIIELLEYCKILNLNPGSLFTETDYPPILLPIQYCTNKQIMSWVYKAKEEHNFKELIRIPFYSAPLLGVSLDIYFYSCNPSNDIIRDLNDLIDAHDPFNVKNRKKTKVNKVDYSEGLSENTVQLQAYITFRPTPRCQSNNSVYEIRPEKAIKSINILNYLKYAEIEFFSKCKMVYESEKEYLYNLINLSGENPITNYCSDTFSTQLKAYLEHNIKKRTDKGLAKAFPKSTFGSTFDEQLSYSKMSR